MHYLWRMSLLNIFLTSSLGASRKVNGVWESSVMNQNNRFLDNLKTLWKPDARVLVIASAPDTYERNDSVCRCLKGAFAMSSLGVREMVCCDGRNPEAVETLDAMDAVILTGGHVPTENRFMMELRLRERLTNYKGLVIGWSAGSMNCAELVYAGPELEGEAIDPLYQRWLTGLGLTNINVFPHFDSLREERLDGMRLIEDITFADSMGHELIALNEDSYIRINNGAATLHGEAYRILDGRLEQICRDGESIVL